MSRSLRMAVKGPGDPGRRGLLFLHRPRELSPDPGWWKSLRLRLMLYTLPSPWMGEGGDGGAKFADATPTFVLPHPGGGQFSLFDFKPTPCEPMGLDW